MRNILLSALFIILFISKSTAQIPIGQWREHLPYNQAIAVAEDGFDRVYVATPFSLFYYSRADESINKISSVNRLSDIGVSTIAFDKEQKTLVVGYENGNLDLMKNDVIYNLSDIKRKQMIGGKRINHIMFFAGKTYISTDFGIVVLDIAKLEIRDTYYIGENGKAIIINKTIVDSNEIIAATSEGIYRADLSNPNLANFQNWHREETLSNPHSNFNTVTIYNNQLIANYKGTTFNSDTLYRLEEGKWNYFKPYNHGPFKTLKTYGDTLIIGEEYGFTYFWNNLVDSFNAFNYNQGGGNNYLPTANDFVVDKKNIVWIADNSRALVRNEREWLYQLIIPTGPSSKYGWSMALENSKLWVASGGYQPTGANSYLRKGVYEFAHEKWTSYNTNSSVFDTIDDVISIAINPKNTSEVYVGTWGQGLIKMVDGKVVQVYDETNSTLENASNRPGFIGIGGLTFDIDGNLWVSNTSSPNGLSRMSPTGVWKSYSLSPYVNEDITGDIVVDDLNQKWMILPRGNGILVYNDNFTDDNPWDDQKTLLNGVIGKGGLPSSTVYSMAKDLDGEMWVGTAKGVAVFYSPELVFSGQEHDAQQIYIEQEGISQYLLESEEVSAVAIDGANRKWFGTRNAGVFLMSDDGTKQIHHFNTSNSPLLSNTVFSIAIDHKSGEVFIATEKGIISYRSDASEGAETHDSVKVFPNPVRPEYHGNVAISGLVRDASVKITDVSGNLVYETTANGGTATWNGKNYSGDRVATGVYLIFSTNEDGSETKVAKVLFIH